MQQTKVPARADKESLVFCFYSYKSIHFPGAQAKRTPKTFKSTIFCEDTKTKEDFTQYFSK